MKYEDLLTVQDTLLNAIAHIRGFQYHANIIKECAPQLTVLLPYSVNDGTLEHFIEQTQDAYNRVSHDVFEYEWEHKMLTIAVANDEDIPF